MSKVNFMEDGAEWWFDPETSEFEYGGDNPLIMYVLANMDKMQDVQTEVAEGDVFGFPGETWTSISPKERKDHVINLLIDLPGVEINV